MYRVDQPSHASRPQWIPQRKMALTQLSPGVQPSRQQGIQNIRSFRMPDIYAFTRAIPSFRSRQDIERTGNLPAEGVRSEEHTSELQSLMRISYDVFCLKHKNNKKTKKPKLE